MGIDTRVGLNSLLARSVDIVSLWNDRIDVSSEGNKTILIDSSIYADEATQLLRYEEVVPVTKVVGARYQEIKPPKQRV
jgi:hypothetical protein